MKTIILTTSFLFLLSGCSYFTFNASMCDSISHDPNAVIPTECRNYNETEAQKAFNKNKQQTKTQSQMDDEIEFHKNKEKEEK